MTYLDDELVEATDALLDGREMPRLNGENLELFQVARQICGVIEPQNPPSVAFDQRLHERLEAEWNRASAQPTLRLVERPLARIAALAAGVVLVLGALIVLAVPDAAEPLQGAAIGFDDAAALVVLFGVVIVGALFYWRGRQ